MNTAVLDEVGTLVQTCLPSLRRWAHGKVRAAARGGFDTADLVQEAAVRTLARGSLFELRHPMALQAYMRRAIVNLIRDEARRVARRPALTEIPDEVRCTAETPLETAIRREANRHSQRALRRLSRKNRRLLIARLYLGRSAAEIADEFGLPSASAARMAVARALAALTRQMDQVVSPPSAAFADSMLSAKPNGSAAPDRFRCRAEIHSPTSAPSHLAPCPHGR